MAHYMASIPHGDIAWLMVVCTAALGFVELTKYQEPQAHFFAMIAASVIVASALLWVALG
jgi:desulfoferrodoxin (superoxide reductase-like protein)